MLKKFFIISVLLNSITSTALASTLTLQSNHGEKIGIDGTYILSPSGKNTAKTADGKLTLTKISRRRHKSVRSNAFVYDGYDKAIFNGTTYKMHFISVTEKNGTAVGIFKTFSTSDKLVDSGTYTYTMDKKLVKDGEL